MLVPGHNALKFTTKSALSPALSRPLSNLCRSEVAGPLGRQRRTFRVAGRLALR